MDVEIAHKKIGGLLEGCAAGKRRVVEQAFRLQDGNRLEEQRFAVHLHAHELQVPVAPANLLLLHAKRSVFVEMAEQSTKKFDLACQTAVDLDQAFLLGIHDQRSFHVVENLG